MPARSRDTTTGFSDSRHNQQIRALVRHVYREPRADSGARQDHGAVSEPRKRQLQFRGTRSLRRSNRSGAKPPRLQTQCEALRDDFVLTAGTTPAGSRARLPIHVGMSINASPTYYCWTRSSRSAWVRFGGGAVAFSGVEIPLGFDEAGGVMGG